MRKLLKNGAFILATGLVISAAFSPNAKKADATDIVGDLYGGARITCVTPIPDDGVDSGYVTEINVGGASNADFSGAGVCIRIKNYTSTITPLTLKISSVNGTVYAPKPSVKQTYYDTNGATHKGTSARGFGNYMMVPSAFDGFIYMDYSTQMVKIEGSQDFDPSHIYRVYVEYSGKFDNYADFAIGDIFTDTKSVLDTSTLSASDFATTFINQSGDVQRISQRAKEGAFVPTGDLNGGVHAQKDDYGGFMVKSSQPSNISGGPLYFRIQNNKATSQWLMVHVASDYFTLRVVTANGAVVSMYNADGTSIGNETVNEYGYFELPANFNGFMKLNWNEFADDWGTGFHNSKVNAVYFEADGIDINVGDIFCEDNVFFDGSEHYAAEFGNFTETWNECNLTVLPGYKPLDIDLFDYTQIEYSIGLLHGFNITSKKNPNSGPFSIASINFGTSGLDLSAGDAVAISFKGNGTYAFGLEFYDVDNNALMMPAKADSINKPIHFIKDGVATSMNHTTGDENTIHEVPGEGVVVIQKDFLAPKSGTSFLWNNVKSIKVSVHTYYDDKLNIVLGDIGAVNQSALSYTSALSVNTISNADFSDYYSVSDEYISVKRYIVSKDSEWIGDVKVIDSLNYASDAEMNLAITYDNGNNPCSYRREDGGIWIHNGPYEVEGHGYGSYMCLAFFDQGATNDRKQAYKMVNEEKVYAKGLTFYAKNLSQKDIGVTLQFDEKIPGRTNTERWCIVGYPAMYYAWDVNTNAEYLMYSKSDQVQIPKGFEGYIRVPFESYEVPQWNKGQEGVDEVLNLDNFSGDFFFTSDNTRYEDLEYIIKNIGMYFNETRKGNLFDNSNTIKANMGL